MIVTNTYASDLRQANKSRNKAESKVKVTKKVIKCKKKLNVTILILCPVVKPPWGYNIWLWRYLPKTFLKISEQTVKALWHVNMPLGWVPWVYKFDK